MSTQPDFREPINTITEQMNRALLGKPSEIQMALSCILAGGHLLIEDVPGVGKTTLARGLAACFKAKFTRVQFTSDLLPSDLIGVTIFKKSKESFTFQPGPMFTNVLLADEINRANPKTQSSLLEAMHENQVSHDGRTFKLPDPFFVVATQNSQDHHGTFPLPEAQLDRFLMRLSLGYPAREFEMRVIRNTTEDELARFQALELETLVAMRRAVRAVHVADPLVGMIYDIVNQTRHHDHVMIGVSPRGAQALFASAQAFAFVQGRDFCTPDDVVELAPMVCSHRMLLKRTSDFIHHRDISVQVIHDVLDRVPIPKY